MFATIYAQIIYDVELGLGSSWPSKAEMILSINPNTPLLSTSAMFLISFLSVFMFIMPAQQSVIILDC